MNIGKKLMKVKNLNYLKGLKSMSKKNEDKTTVSNIKENFDWGKILFNACYIFNMNLAKYWLDYVDNYEKNRIQENSLNEIEFLTKRRDKILDYRDKLHLNVKKYSNKTIKSYRDYTKTLLIGDCVRLYRKENIKSSKYLEIINNRKELLKEYYSCSNLLKNAITEEEEYKKYHLFETRNIGNKVKTLKKIVDIHELQLHHSLMEDRDVVYDFLISEEQTERLMGVCLNILNTYSEKEFSTMMSIKDRENIAENIFNYFYNFSHNYDFLVGCYERKDDNKLYLKDLEILKNKLYNGYYFTIRGFVQRSYSTIRKEHFNIESVDDNWKDDAGNGNHGFDNYINTDDLKGGYSTIAVSSERYKLSEGMITFWEMCCDYLNQHIDEMANELLIKMSGRFSHMTYYSQMSNNIIMKNIFKNILLGITQEISQGKNIGNKLKHIVLDAMGGAETKEEWKQCVDFITNIIKKNMQNFFLENQKELYNNWEEL